MQGTLHLDDRRERNRSKRAQGLTSLIVPPGRLQHLATSSDSVTEKAGIRRVRTGAPTACSIVDATDGKGPTLRIACGAVTPDASGSLWTIGKPDATTGRRKPLRLSGGVCRRSRPCSTSSAPTEGTEALTSAPTQACPWSYSCDGILRASRLTGTAAALFHDATRVSRAITAILDRARRLIIPSNASSAQDGRTSRSAFARRVQGRSRTGADGIRRPRPIGFRRPPFRRRQGPALKGIAAAAQARAAGSHFSRLFHEHSGTDSLELPPRHQGKGSRRRGSNSGAPSSLKPVRDEPAPSSQVLRQAQTGGTASADGDKGSRGTHARTRPRGVAQLPPSRTNSPAHGLAIIFPGSLLAACCW